MADVPTLLGGRYEVGELLGRGGMAEVHEGYDTRLGRTVAIKMLRSDLARDNTFLSRFRREAQSAAGLNHASIVAIYDHGEDHVFVETGGAEVNVPYIVMEYVDGRTLREVLTERGQLDPDEACRITEGVLDALGYSHRQGIVHRDIKPANVMIARDGSVKVMDFGIARAIADASATVTATQAVIGTAQYLSPEQAQGQHVDARSDLYSTGCMLFELLTGRPPFQGESPVAIAYQHVGEQPPPPSRFVDGIPTDLDAVVLHALTKPRDQRYQDAAEFGSDLQAVRLGRPISPAAHGATAAVAGAALAGAASTEYLPALGATDHGTQTMAAQPPVLTPPPGPTTGDLPYDDEEKRRSPALYVLLTLAVIAALGLLGWGLFSYLGSGNDTPKVQVPSVVGQPLQTAQVKMAQAKLTVDVRTEASDTVPKDEVIRQDPTGGSEVAPNSKVTLTVSGGPDAVAIPDLKGKTVDEATQLLSDLGLKVGTVTKQDDPNTQEGQIISSDPGSGASATPGSKVNLVVGSGKVKVPNLVGLTLSEAQQALSDAGLQPDTQFQQTDAVPENQVLSQTPKQGTSVDAGSTVKIVVAQKAPPTTSAPPPTSPGPSGTPSPSPSATP